MRPLFFPSLLLLAACAPAAQVRRVDEKALANKSLSIAVLDVYDADDMVEPSVLQMNLTRVLITGDYRNARTEARTARTLPWSEEEASERAKQHKVQATLIVDVYRVGEKKRNDDRDPGDGLYSTRSDGTGRREYFVRERDEERSAAVEVRATVRLVDRKGTVIYEAELKVPAENLTESTLAESLLAPLEGY